jgi:ATP-binding cassette subfamily B protein
MQRDVLSHFNLTARAGEVTQIEGENGFGKTTLLKLLLRLYDTDKGAVLIDGVDVRQYDLRELRRGIGAIFQDYVRFYCTAEENIAFGDISRHDSARVKKVAELAGVDKYIERLPKGYQTPLGRMFDDGEELSMGQWQRIALARQLYSDAPVLIFDEPTAWMDVPSRDRFYRTLEELKAEGKVIILIKHV